MQFYKKHDAYSLCRACLQALVEGNINSSITKYDIFLTPDLPKKFVLCTSLSCEPADGLPKYLCSCCYDKLNDFSQFQTMCVESAKRFDAIIESSLMVMPFEDEKPEFDLEAQMKVEITVSEPDILFQSEIVETKNKNALEDKYELEGGTKLQEVKRKIRGKGHSAKTKGTHDTVTTRIDKETILNNRRRGRSRCVTVSCVRNDSSSETAETSEEHFKWSDRDLTDESVFQNTDNSDDDITIRKTNKNIAAKSRETEIYSSSAILRSRKRKLRIKRSCDELPPSSNMKNSVFQCDVCPTRFFVEHRLVAHKRSHDGLVPYPCPRDGCDKAFNRWHCLSEHLKQHEGTNQWFTCEENGCGKVYKHKPTLVMHLRKYHKLGPELKSHICEICGKVFKSSAILNDHRYTHKDKSELPFACEHAQCMRRFSNKEKLKVHLMRHAGIKNFECPFCGMRKTTRNELKVHINYHTLERTWPCRFCKHVCNSAGNLKMHVRTVHERAKDYACRYCERTFAKPDTRKYHEMTHTGEKPNECQECGKRFTQPAALRTHKKIHQRHRIQTTLPTIEIATTDVDGTATNSKKIHTSENESFTATTVLCGDMEHSFLSQQHSNIS